ncbi:MAG: hypothetical protein KBA26_12250 [Candidatus Delongbacteria bacterium]|nr:hypothetical protein [Candidatus Delongbacteria bacterium]
MDKIEFKVIEEIDDHVPYDSVRILINGIDLIDMLREYEMKFAQKEGSPSIAGSYVGLMPMYLYQYLTEPNQFNIYDDHKAIILGCDCGCEGCWPMMIKILKDNNRIIWTEFEQPHRGPTSRCYWNYNEFGVFIFDLDNYNLQLDELKKYFDEDDI